MATEAVQEPRTAVLTLDLPEDVLKDVQAACAISGTTPEEFARKAILRHARMVKRFAEDE